MKLAFDLWVIGTFYYTACGNQRSRSRSGGTLPSILCGNHQNLLFLSKSLNRACDKICENLPLKCYYMCQMAKHGQGAGKSSCNYIHVHASSGPEKLKCDHCFTGIGIQGFKSPITFYIVCAFGTRAFEM